MTTAVRTEYDSRYFGGEWFPTASGERVEVVSKHSEETIGSTPCATEADVDRAIALARQAFDRSPWPHLPPQERAAAVQRILDSSEARVAQMTETVIAEMGSPCWFAELAQGPGGAAMLATFLDAACTIEWEQAGRGHEYGPVGLEGNLECEWIYDAP